MPELDSHMIILGISGGIAAYKSVELARLMIKAGADVIAVMTEAAEHFIAPLTLRTLTGNPVASTLWADPSSPVPHISLSDAADLIVVAPATADIIGKCANGLADDLLSTTLLAACCTVLLAPAMNERMYMHPAVRENLRKLQERGVVVVDPGTGELACGSEGVGRMCEPAEIMRHVVSALSASGRRDLQGRRVIVTAGPTREAIDPVRFISNPSTGLMGFKVAEAATRRGADVTLIAGPTHLSPPAVKNFESIVTAEEMKRAVMTATGNADALVMAAAPADFKPAETAGSKIKKSDGVPEITLVQADDILTAVEQSGRRPRVVVGFAAETDCVTENAKKKLAGKRLDIIVANTVDEPGSGFGCKTDRACIICSADEDASLEMTTKAELAERLLDEVSRLLSS